MYDKITGSTPLAALTVSQFVELLDQGKSLEPATTSRPADYMQGYVYGLKGIRQLFGVSHATAQRYKDTILRPAVRQNGKKIVVDVAKALELFDEHSKKQPL
jgi:hypothetical protein